jgi:DNA mismatch endonuclease (patch repair protein)
VNTSPELAVRRMLWRMGFRYRIHGRGLPGRPDIVFANRRKAVFVHGCFWHHHEGCGRMPKSRLDFWATKLMANRERDLRKQRELIKMGWGVLVVWECELKHLDALAANLRAFLRS